MSNQTVPKNPLQFFQAVWQQIVLLFGVITGVFAFVKAFQDNFDLYAKISLITCIMLIWLTCLYYARFWNPEVQDKGLEKPSNFAPPQEWEQYESKLREQEQDQAVREQQRKQIRHRGITGLIIIPLISVAGFFHWQYVQSLPPNETIILVADFYNQDTENDDYSVTSTIWERLESEIEGYAGVELNRVEQLIDVSEDARQIGEQRKAAMVMWGWYNTKPEDTVPVSINFEILCSLDCLPDISREVQGEVQAVATAELESLKFQFRLRDQISNLTLFVLGMVEYETKNWNGAVEWFTKSLDQLDEPISALNQIYIYLFRGSSYSSLKDFDQAIADYDKAIELDPKLAISYKKRGMAYANKGDYDRAIAEYTKAITLKPDDAGAYNCRGVAFSSKGDYEQAIIEYNKAIEIDPELALAYGNRGVVHSDKNDYEQAIVDYNKAIKLDSESATFYNNRGFAFYKQGNHEQAITDYDKAIGIDPESAIVYSNRGVTYSKLGNYERAMADFAKAIELNPESVHVYSNRSSAFYEQGNYEQAMADCSKTIELDPGFALAYNNCGLAYSGQGAHERAISDYDKAIELDPELAVAYNNRGTAYSYHGDYEQAIVDFTKAIELDPELAVAYNNRGTAYSYHGDYERAIADYDKAIELDPDNASAYFNRGMAQLEGGDHGQGYDDFNKAVELDPSYCQKGLSLLCL